MTVIINIGRRVPKSWFRRQANRGKGLITFQENLWLMIKQSMAMAKRKANEAGTLEAFNLTNDKEDEDLHYQLEWVKIKIQGTKEQEKEEYEEAMEMYKPLGKILKKDMPEDERFKKLFKSKLLNPAKITEAYESGYGSIGDRNISNKLLEMGIMTHIEWVKDFDSRKIVID